MQNPFSEDIFPANLFEDGSVNVPDIHRRTLAHIEDEVTAVSATGLEIPDSASRNRMILLRAPRAGYGKTHLFSRLAMDLAERAVVVPVRLNLDQPVAWGTLLRQLLDRFADHGIGASPLHLTFIEEAARRVFAEITSLLIREGEIPTGNPDAAISGLRRNYLRLFDFKSNDHTVCDWLANNFEQLRPVMANVLAEKRMTLESGAAFWLGVFREISECRPSEIRDILREASLAGADKANGNVAKLRLANFCRIVTMHKPVVFLFDHLDCFYGDQKKGLQIAYILTELRSLAPGQLAIVAANDDLWRATFAERLPSAFEDRLAADPACLDALPLQHAEALVRLRCLDAGVSEEDAEAFLKSLDLAFLPELDPRSVLRHARKAWEKQIDAQDAPPAVFGNAKKMAPISPFKLADPGEIPSADALMEKETRQRAEDAARDARESGTDFLATPSDAGFVGEKEKEPTEPGEAPANPFVFHSEPEKVDPAKVRKKSDLLARLQRLKSKRDAAEAAESENREDTEVERELERERPALNGSAAGSESPVPPSAPLAERFQSRRRELLANGGLSLDQVSLRRLVGLTAEQSPLVEQSEIPIAPEVSLSTTRWKLPGHEILFGFGARGDKPYWQEIFRYADDHAVSSDAGEVKLIVFSEPQRSFFDDAGMPRSSNCDAYLDIVELDQEALASIQAAVEILRDPPGFAPLSENEALGQLSDGLEFFWRRITRPLPAKT